VLCADAKDSLAPLKHKDVIALKTDVARTANEVTSEKKEVLQMITKLTSAGI
jgi:hypothetical protein